MQKVGILVGAMVGFGLSFALPLTAINHGKVSPHSNFWQEAERIRSQLIERQIVVAESNSVDLDGTRFSFQLKRLENIGKDKNIARYILESSEIERGDAAMSPVSNHLRIGLIDHFPEDSVGQVQIVAIRESN